MKTLFAPGCALRAYKPTLVSGIARFLSDRGLIDGIYTTCCKLEHTLTDETTLIICCPGCARMFERIGPHIKLVSLWSVLADTDFPFPDYHGRRMSIQDSCHARHRDSAEMQRTSRSLCERMGIEIVEPEYTRDRSRCCGGSAPDLATREAMARRRAAEFPEDDVVVYCTGCVRSLSITDVRPRHLLDLLFSETTEGLTPKGWVDRQPV